MKAVFDKTDKFTPHFRADWQNISAKREGRGTI